ncbi:MAG: hypothetical protein QOF07_2798 [Bradyrhizobium sp.]|jgi:hypothetical protein|nr:hypothetical protein [Bradyrhizobium sp.]
MPKKSTTTLSIIIIALSFGVAAGWNQRPNIRLPRFDEYRVAGAPNSIGKIIGMDRGDFKESTAQFRKRIRDAAKTGPNFAGHYAIVGWSCGMICLNLAIVDVKTNRIYDLPFVGIADGPCPAGFYHDDRILVDFRRNSRLMIVRGSTEEKGPEGVQDQPCSTRYYVWKRNRLVLLRKLVAPDS